MTSSLTLRAKALEVMSDVDAHTVMEVALAVGILGALDEIDTLRQQIDMLEDEIKYGDELQ